MGFNDEHAARIVFDIETAPLPEAGEYIESAEAPGNYKDAAKIAAFIEEKNAENLSKCGLDVDLCRVVAIGVQAEDGKPYVLRCQQPEGEAQMLRAFWVVYGHRHLVGFNCLAFDLPVLLRRSLYLGVTAPSIVLDKYRHPQVTDLMQVLSYGGAIRARSLAFYSRRFGITSGPDTLTGADIAQAVLDGRWADIEAHVSADVQKTARIAEKLGLFRPVLEAVL